MHVYSSLALAAIITGASFAAFGQAGHTHAAPQGSHSAADSGKSHGTSHGHAGGYARGHMDKRFTDPEALAKSFDKPERAAWQMPDRVIADLGLKPGQSVADIGAGTGYFSVRLARSAAKPTVYSVDIEESMLAYLAKRAGEEGLTNVTTVLGGMESAKLPEPVDVVLVVNTYHHIADRLSYFRDLRKNLRKGGKLAIVDWKKGAPMGPADEYRFTPDEIRRELAGAGFRAVGQHDYLPNQNFLMFTVD
ncbi:MAG: class I SAM-dependent methyltransferase [Bryobacterales bacterium]|nr:class I SAM-dependent methyltransferase [Bryobacterales bacterium]